MEMRGIDPRTSRMLSERSTIWATSPFLYLYYLKYYETEESLCVVLRPYVTKLYSNLYPDLSICLKFTRTSGARDFSSTTWILAGPLGNCFIHQQQKIIMANFLKKA